jgi:hypothetical protein
MPPVPRSQTSRTNTLQSITFAELNGHRSPGVNNVTFPLNVHFCNSRFPIFSRIDANGGAWKPRFSKDGPDIHRPRSITSTGIDRPFGPQCFDLQARTSLSRWAAKRSCSCGLVIAYFSIASLMACPPSRDVEGPAQACLHRRARTMRHPAHRTWSALRLRARRRLAASATSPASCRRCP